MSIEQQLQKINAEIEQHALAAKRDPRLVKLLAVSKKQSIEKIKQAYAAGQRAFGENYAQEALDKMHALAELAIEWHFIGPIQSNKTKAIANHFDYVHSIDRVKIAKRLNEQRADELAPLRVFIQVNPTAEATKQGCSLADLPELVTQIKTLPKLELQGLMTLPPASNEYKQQLAYFEQLAQIQTDINQSCAINMQQLSMGMSNDYPAAIAAGSTLIRLGTIIFGNR